MLNRVSVFVPLRLFAGGYHATSYARCFIISNLSYLLVLLIKNITWENTLIEMWSILLVSMCCYIIKNTPIINSAQPINEGKQKRSKKVVKIILIVDVFWIFYFAFRHKELMVMVVLSICLVATMMMVSKISMSIHRA